MCAGARGEGRGEGGGGGRECVCVFGGGGGWGEQKAASFRVGMGRKEGRCVKLLSSGKGGREGGGKMGIGHTSAARVLFEAPPPSSRVPIHTHTHTHTHTHAHTPRRFEKNNNIETPFFFCRPSLLSPFCFPPPSLLTFVCLNCLLLFSPPVVPLSLSLSLSLSSAKATAITGKLQQPPRHAKYIDTAQQESGVDCVAKCMRAPYPPFSTRPLVASTTSRKLPGGGSS